MKKDLLLVLVDGRKQSAVKVQQILTEWGCLIKTRLGIHDGVLDNCTEHGLIILELVGDPDKHQEMTRKLNLLPGVKAKLENLEVED